MTKKQTISNLLAFTYEELRENLRVTDLQVFKDMKSILVIRSASFQTLESFIRKVRDENTDLRIHVVTHSRDVQQMRLLMDDKLDTVEYRAGGAYHVDFMTDCMEPIREASPDAFVMLWDNEIGIGYDNVIEIAYTLTDAPSYAYNDAGRLVEVVNVKDQITNLQLIKAIVDWNWDLPVRHEISEEE